MRIADGLIAILGDIILGVILIGFDLFMRIVFGIRETFLTRAVLLGADLIMPRFLFHP